MRENRGCSGCVTDFMVLLVLLLAAAILFGEWARQPRSEPAELRTVDGQLR